MKTTALILLLFFLQIEVKAQNLVSGSSASQENELMLGLKDTANIIAIQGPVSPSGNTPSFVPTGTISIGHIQTCDSTCHPPPALKKKSGHPGTN